MAGLREEAFDLAQSTGHLEEYAKQLGDHGTQKDHQELAKAFEGQVGA